MKRIVSIWLSDWSLDRLYRLSSAPNASAPVNRDASAVVLTAHEAGAVHITAANARARAAGIAPGDRLADARACVRDMVSIPADPVSDARAVRRLAKWMMRWTPCVAIDGADGLFLDITGCARLFGGEKALLADICARLSRCGITHRLALSDTPGAAWALARYAQEESVICASGTQRDALSSLPIKALRLSEGIVDVLARFGLTRIADLIGIPRAALARRCSGADDVVMRLDQACGRRPEPLAFIQPPAAERVVLACPEPLRHAEGIRSGLETLLSRLCARLKRDGRGARALSFSVFRSDGQVRAVTVRTAWPTCDPSHAAVLFTEHLDRIDAGEGVDCLLLEATRAERVHAITRPLSARWGGGIDTAALGRLVDRLSMKMQVHITAARAAHIPEHSETRAPVNEHLGRAWSDVSMPPRPLRLLSRPEPVDALAKLPDSPPVRFIWRRISYRIVRADGPERIAPQWWHDDTSRDTSRDRAREYYRLEDSEGQRFWLFRLQDQGAAPRWYVHGLFA